MSHYRSTLREAIRAALVAADTTAGARVFKNPTDDRTRFPALVIEDDGESQRALTMPAGTDRVIERRYSFTVRAEVQQVAGYDDARDTLAAEVESSLAAAGVVSGVKAITPAGCDFSQDNGGERPIAVATQRFEALYFTTQGAPGVPI